MKTIFLTALLATTLALPASAQTPPDVPDTHTGGIGRDVANHNLGWLGLLGLIGLVGLRPRKSADHERLEATGVNVKSVKV